LDNLPASPPTQDAHIRQLEEALDPFERVFNIQPPGKESWLDSKPNSEFIPGAWPNWGDFRRAAQALAKAKRS
jgi:hypothetical protein